MSTDHEINDIIEQLKADSVPAQPKPAPPVEEVNDSNVGEYVYKKSAELVESTLHAVENLKDSVMSGSDPREIAALSQLINSATKALDQLNKINIKNKQNKNNMEMKKLEISANAERPQLPNMTNVFVATRDEIMKQIYEKPSKKVQNLDLIEGEFTKE